MNVPQMTIYYGMPSRRPAVYIASIPMRLLNEEWAQRNHGQSLSRLNERGGLSLSEIVANVERRRWHSMPEKEALEIVLKLS